MSHFPEEPLAAARLLQDTAVAMLVLPLWELSILDWALSPSNDTRLGEHMGQGKKTA